MLKEVFLARFEPAVTCFGPFNGPKRVGGTFHLKVISRERDRKAFGVIFCSLPPRKESTMHIATTPPIVMGCVPPNSCKNRRGTVTQSNALGYVGLRTAPTPRATPVACAL